LRRLEGRPAPQAVAAERGGFVLQPVPHVRARGLEGPGQAVRAWLQQHKQRVKREGGGRLMGCPLPSKSPWLNPMAPRGAMASGRLWRPHAS
jgi:hypothetical protein